jgi:hypothetical protein
MTSKEALASLRMFAKDRDTPSEAVETMAAEIAQLRSLAYRVIDAGVTRWHIPDEEMTVIEWLELNPREYADWVQRTGIFAADSPPYRLDDDEAIMRGYNAIKQMHIMRVGDQAAHAQAFRDALNG